MVMLMTLQYVSFAIMQILSGALPRPRGGVTAMILVSNLWQQQTDYTSQTEDIDLSGNRYNLLGTIFYIAYILSQ